MSAQKFLTDIENGVVPVNSHDKVLRIAFIYMDEVLWCGTGVFDVIEKLHAHGWSFGVGELRLNRTLDLFYLAQIAAGIYRSSNQIEDIFPSPDEFDTFYTDHHALLHPSAWRAYYSEPFLKQNTTARFYRLPDLPDLPDSDSPLDEPRERSHPGGGPHATKLPRWAYNVARTHLRQPILSLATLTNIALSTLEATINRLRMAHAPDPGRCPGTCGLRTASGYLQRRGDMMCMSGKESTRCRCGRQAGNEGVGLLSQMWRMGCGRAR